MTRPKYSIPADGEVLNTAQLRAHTAFTIAEALRSLRGRWGFFSPSDLDPDEKANHFSVDGDCLLVQNLALILPDGFTCRERELREQISPGGGSIIVKWTLPENHATNDGAVHVDLKIMGKDGKGETENATADPHLARVAGPIGDVDEANHVVLSAPALSLDAEVELHDAWENLVDVLDKQIAGPIEKSSRGGPFERRLVSRALRRLRSVPRDTEPAGAIREFGAAIEILVDFATTYDAGDEVVRETESLLLTATRQSGAGGVSHNGTADLVELFRKIVGVANDGLESTVSWIRGGNRLVLNPEASHETDDSQTVFVYSIPETASLILITFSGDGAIDAWINFAGDWEPVHDQAGEGGILKIRRKLPPGTRKFRCKCAENIKVSVEVG